MNPQPTFHQHLTAWKWAVAGKSHAPLPPEIVAASPEEFSLWSNQLAQAKVDANKAGYQCQFNKGSKPGRSAAWVVSGGHTLKVVFTAKKQPTKKGVAATSIEKYHSLDTRGQTMQVAMVAASLTQKHGHTTDSQVAEFVGIPSARVSARRNEIERLQGVVLAGTPHYFETAGRVVCPVTGSSVNGWRVVAAGQTSLFQ